MQNHPNKFLCFFSISPHPLESIRILAPIGADAGRDGVSFIAISIQQLSTQATPTSLCQLPSGNSFFSNPLQHPTPSTTPPWSQFFWPAKSILASCCVKIDYYMPSVIIYLVSWQIKLCRALCTVGVATVKENMRNYNAKNGLLAG